MKLHGSRSYGWGPNPISSADTHARFRIEGIDGEDALDFDEIISRLDREFLKWHTAKEKARAKKP